MSHQSASILFALMLALPVGLVAFAPSSVAEGERVEQVTIRTFDDTELAATLFVPNTTADVPFVLMTHGWAGTRTSTLSGRVADLVAAGYGVLTWDSRGFGASGGEVMLNSPDYEVRDVSALIDWLVANAPVAQVEGDPVIGMSGGSYAGGIQLLSAAFDSRIDVITPEITWNDLAKALAPADVPKTQWISALLGAGAAASCSDGHELSPTPSGCQTSALARYYATVMATNGVTPEVRAALTARSPATYMEDIDVPALLIQGYPDTLFDVDQAAANYHGVKANGAPAKLWLYDGGHALPGSSVPNTQGSLISAEVIEWFGCYLALAPSCEGVGDGVEYYVGGEWRTSASWPPAGSTVTATTRGVPPLAVAPLPTGSQGSWTFTLLDNAANTTVAAAGATLQLKASVSAGEAFLLAGLGVRTPAGVVTRVDGQLSPARAVGAAPTTLTIDLVDVAAALAPGEDLVVIVQTFDPAFNGARNLGFVTMTDIVLTTTLE